MGTAKSARNPGRHAHPCAVRSGLSSFNRQFVISLLVATLWLTPRVARACGGGFGEGIEAVPDQQIVVAYGDGVERYVLAPVFCGSPAEFGLIVPVPRALTKDPEDIGVELRSELEQLAAPRLVEREHCIDPDTSQSGGSDGAGGGGGVHVIGEGTTGAFDWTLLDASSTAAFTGWLDERQFPYESEAVAAFQHYVDQGWMFVAFTISPDAEFDSSSFCESPGNVELVFPSEAPVIPARIVATDANSLSTNFTWDVFVIADTQMHIAGAGSSAQLRFAGELTPARLSEHPRVASYAEAGQWLTKLTVSMSGADIDGDLVLEVEDEPSAFREVDYVDVDTVCDGCGCRIVSRSVGGAFSLALAMGAVVLFAGRRRAGRSRPPA